MQLRVANRRIADVIGQLWLGFGGVCQVLFTLWLVMHSVGKMFQRVSNLFSPAGYVLLGVRDVFKRIRVA